MKTTLGSSQTANSFMLENGLKAAEYTLPFSPSVGEQPLLSPLSAAQTINVIYDPSAVLQEEVSNFKESQLLAGAVTISWRYASSALHRFDAPWGRSNLDPLGPHSRHTCPPWSWRSINLLAFPSDFYCYGI